MQEGSWTPWGPVQHVTQLATGAWTVDTAGHGGVKLSAERNRKVPVAARDESGWYEEDCNWAVAAYVHEDVGTAALAHITERDPTFDVRGYIVGNLKRWQSAEALAALGID